MMALGFDSDDVRDEVIERGRQRLAAMINELLGVGGPMDEGPETMLMKDEKCIDISNSTYRMLWFNPGVDHDKWPQQFGSVQEVIQFVYDCDDFDGGSMAQPLVLAISQKYGVLAAWGPEAGLFGNMPEFIDTMCSGCGYEWKAPYGDNYTCPGCGRKS